MAADAQARRRFAEEAGDMMEEHGLSHMAGHVFGALEICVPLRRSMDELAEELEASKGSISMATQMLLRFGLIERVSLPGHRRRYDRVRPDVWMGLFAYRAERFRRHRDLAASGLAVLEGEPIEAKERLLEMMVFFDFVEEEMTHLIERWKTRHPALRAAALEEHGGGS